MTDAELKEFARQHAPALAAPMLKLIAKIVEKGLVGIIEQAAIERLSTAKAEPAEDAARLELEQYRKALHYVAFALHSTPQYMLATGITLMDNDRVAVNIGGIAVDTGRVADHFAAFDAAKAEAERKSAAAGESR